MKFWTALLACGLLMATVDAEAARRLGGGSSIGRQSNNVTQRDAARAPQAPANNTATPSAQPGTPGAAPTTAPQPAAAAAQRPAPAGAAPQPATGSRWGGILGGVAAGLGLAWLAHSLGLGAEFGQFLLFALLALVIMVAVGAILRARRGGSAPARSPYALQGAGAGNAPADAPAYNPAKVGNDASARPWESQHTHFDAGTATASPTGGVRIGSGLAGGNWSIPAGFDVQGFVEAAKRNFVTLQDAWDRSDISTLRSMMTDEMVHEIRTQLADRESHRGAGPNKTEVVMLEGSLLGIEDLGDAYMASVEFSGLIREEPSAGPSPFREVWNMTKPKDGSAGWLVAGVQALQ